MLQYFTISLDKIEQNYDRTNKIKLQVQLFTVDHKQDTRQIAKGPSQVALHLNYAHGQL